MKNKITSPNFNTFLLIILFAPIPTQHGITVFAYLLPQKLAELSILLANWSWDFFKFS